MSLGQWNARREREKNPPKKGSSLSDASHILGGLFSYFSFSPCHYRWWMSSCVLPSRKWRCGGEGGEEKRREREEEMTFSPPAAFRHQRCQDAWVCGGRACWTIPEYLIQDSFLNMTRRRKGRVVMLWYSLQYSINSPSHLLYVLVASLFYHSELETQDTTIHARSQQELDGFLSFLLG